MKPDVKNFISNSKVNFSEIKENITFNGKYFPQRFLFVKLQKFLKDFLFNKSIEPRMIGIAGIRGVGKTTLLWQLAYSVKKQFNDIDVYFISMDLAVDYNFKNTDIIEGLADVLPKNKKSVLLFDELQYMDNWDLMLKIIYDKFKNLFIVATGSSSLLIHSTIDLSTRWTLETLYPLSFPEFVMIRSWLKTNGKNPIFPEKDLGKKIRSILFYSTDISTAERGLKQISENVKQYYSKLDDLSGKIFFQNYLNQYIFYHNIPRLLFLDEKKEIMRRIFDMLKRILYQDLREFYEENEIYKISRMLVYLAFLDELNEEKISSNFGIKKDKVSKILQSLTKAEILLKFPVYGGVKTIVKKEKLFFTSSSIRYAILKQVSSQNFKYVSKVYEDIVALYLKRNLNDLVYYGGYHKDRTPDFIVESDFKLIPIEVGTQKKNTSQLNVPGMKYGILINFRSENFSVQNNKILLPLKWFLLM